MIYLLILFLLVLLVCGGLYAIAWKGITAHFAGRCDEDPNLRYLTAADFPDLACREVLFPSGTRQLSGAFYVQAGHKGDRGLILFCHGYGAGHHSYTRLIHDFCLRGYTVFSWDNTGCAASPGEGIRSFYQGVKDLQAAFTYLRTIPHFDEWPIALCGHSWGGYVVCQAPALPEAARVKAIAAFSPLEDPAVNIAAQMAARTHLPAPLFLPFVRLVLVRLDGRAAIKPCSQVLTDGKIPAILYHGTADTSVPPENSVVKAPATGDDPKLRTRMLQGRGHNVYQTTEAEQYLAKTFAGIAVAVAEKAKKKPGSAARLEALYAHIDYDLITETDPAILEEVCAFYERAFTA